MDPMHALRSLPAQQALAIVLVAVLIAVSAARAPDVETRALLLASFALFAYMWFDDKTAAAEVTKKPAAKFRDMISDFRESAKIVKPDLFDLANTSDATTLRFLWMQPRVVEALTCLRAFRVHKKGTLQLIVSQLERFYELFYTIMMGHSTNVKQDAEILLDLRNHALNELENLHMAFPSKLWSARLSHAILVVQSDTYSCLRAIHNKYGSTELHNNYFYLQPKPNDRTRNMHMDLY